MRLKGRGAASSFRTSSSNPSANIVSTRAEFFNPLKMDPQVREADLATPDRIEGELIDRPPGQRPDPGRLSRSIRPGRHLSRPGPLRGGHRNPATDSSSAGAPGLTQARSRAISAITVVWYLASIASSV